MAKFQMQELVDVKGFTARLGAGAGAANQVDDKEVGKPVKLIADSLYNLCVAGDSIEGYVASVEGATADGFTMCTVVNENRKQVTFDGLQATPGTGTVAVGDYVVTGTAPVKGTALTGPMKVCKATLQPSSVPATLTEAGSMVKNSMFAWRIVSMNTTGAVGGVGVIERVGAAV